jgi:phage repressor protein C with HTH and peptisase S24 domain/DNA-binding transcriptional regulator YiaG
MGFAYNKNDTFMAKKPLKKDGIANTRDKGYDDTTRRIMEIMAEENLSLSKFARVMGVTKTVVAYYKRKGSSMPVSMIRLLFKNLPRYSPDWVLYGEGPKYAADDNAPRYTCTIANPQSVYALDGNPQLTDSLPTNIDGGVATPAVPVYTSATLLGLDAQALGRATAAGHITAEYVREGDVAVVMRGQSMYPTIADGDIVVLRERRTPRFVPDRFYVVALDDDACFGYVDDSMPGMLTVRGYNPLYPPLQLDAADVRRVYIVVARISPFRVEGFV